MADSVSPKHLIYQQEKNWMWVGVHTKPCGSGAVAMLDSKELANDYFIALGPVYQKRYGSDTELEIVEVQGHFRKKDKDEMAVHSKTVRARINTGNLAPNKKVQAC